MFLKHVFKDKKIQMDVVVKSGLDWTVVRPTQLIEKPLKGSIKISLDKAPGRKIPREEVSKFIVGQISSTDYLHKMPAISY